MRISPRGRNAAARSKVESTKVEASGFVRYFESGGIGFETKIF